METEKIEKREKKCGHCKEIKSISDFYHAKDKIRNIKIPQSNCKKCALEATKKRYERRQRAVHGLIGLQSYLKKWPIERCMICGGKETAEMNGKKIGLAKDHNHKTGRNRGILCRQCNLMIGFAREDIHILASAMSYLVVYSGT